MKKSHFLLRNYKPDDYSALDMLMRSAQDCIPLELKLLRPEFAQEKDLFLALNQENILMGYVFVIWEKKIKRAILEIYVPPKNRGHRIGGCLLEKGLRRSRELGAAAVHIVSNDDQNQTGGFFCRQQFHKVRTYLNMEISLKEYKPEPAVGAEFHFTYLGQRKESDLAELQNSIFSSSWGYCPNSAQDIKYYLRITGCQPEDILLLKKYGKTAGYLWPQIKPEQGRIHMCGILSELRGKGFGRILLSEGLNYFAAAGSRTVSLTVDEQNTAAVSLYSGLGFVLSGRQVWWEYVLNTLS